MTHRARTISQKKCSTIPILLSLVQATKKEQRQRRARNNRSYKKDFLSYDKSLHLSFIYKRYRCRDFLLYTY
nr:MAG TPA: hypothetical protein [Caudoviricetes sp.]